MNFVISTSDCEQCDLRSAFFTSFSGADLEIFCDQKTDISFSRGEIIFKEGNPIQYFSYLKSGLVKLYRTDATGKDQIIFMAGPFDFVVYMFLKFSTVIYNSRVFLLPVSRREIAEYIGMTTEGVIRSLSEFRKEKMIRINGREIEMLDINALERISSYG